MNNTQSGNYEPMIQKNRKTKIKIGNNVWLGAKTIVMDGCDIGDNSVIRAGAVVTKSIPDYSVAAGIPARIIKDRRTQ
jgi:acetyltransferase-like isoleucine patch superfamily enzyme